MSTSRLNEHKAASERIVERVVRWLVRDTAVSDDGKTPDWFERQYGKLSWNGLTISERSEHSNRTTKCTVTVKGKMFYRITHLDARQFNVSALLVSYLKDGKGKRWQLNYLEVLFPNPLKIDCHTRHMSHHPNHPKFVWSEDDYFEERARVWSQDKTPKENVTEFKRPQDKWSHLPGY